MDNRDSLPLPRVTPLLLAWLAVVVLTFAGIALGHWLRDIALLPLLVAAIIWLKAWLVARYYLDLRQAHVFIRRMVSVFAAFVPLALVLTDLFGDRLARWLTL